MPLVHNRRKNHKHKALCKVSSQRHNKWIKKGDEVIVVSGNHKGAKGEVVNRTNTHVTVRDVNMRKKATRKSEQNPQGGHVAVELPIHASNVSLHVEGIGAVKLSHVSDDNGSRLVYEKDGQEVTHRVLKSVNG